MRRRRFPTAWVCLVFIGGAARAQPAADEQAEIQSQLQQKKAVLSLLQTQRVSALELMDLFQRLSSATSRRAAKLERRVKFVQKRVELAERQDALAESAFAQQVSDVSPRLISLYRLLHRNPLRMLLSTEDLTTLVRQRRELNFVVEADLVSLEGVRSLAQFQKRSHQELARVKLALSSQLSWEKGQAARFRQQQRDLSELADLIKAEASRSRRWVRDLEQADRELSQSLAQGAALSSKSGFGSLYGRLPMPTEGTIEVGFGKVVNPRFHTTTLQKGLDIRAPEGTEVRAVASGQVVYAGWLLGYGNVLILDHGNGFHSLVAHLREGARTVGEEVRAGDPLGTVGDTGSLKGPYLYFELRQKGVAVDPMPWLEIGKAPSPGEVR